MAKHVEALWAQIVGRAPRGQIFVLTAFVLVVALGLIGSGVDYGVMLVEKTRVQNAVDAASLAGARGLVAAPTPGTTSAQATITASLAQHGYANGINNTTVSSIFLTPTPTGSTDTVRINVSRQKPTVFLQLLGISSMSVGGTALAQAGTGLYDVVLAVDETSSMTCCASGTDMYQLRQASQAFADQLQLSPGAARSSKLALAQFQGRTGTCPGASCRLDAHVLTNLTSDPAVVAKIVNNTGGGACPALPAQPASGFTVPGVPTTYGCPLQAPGGSGTYELSGIQITFGAGWDLWSTAKGGRTEAHKVLVLETDGLNNVTNTTALTVTQANTNSVNAANAIKPGADGTLGTADDIEIYTVGFFDSGESGLIGTTPPGCPANSLPAGRTATDNELISMSSSKAGTCDHYYPLAKSASLPAVFNAIANAIKRGTLLQ